MSLWKADDIQVSPDSFPDTPWDLSVVFESLAGNRGEGSRTCVVMADPDFPQISQAHRLHGEDVDAVPLKLVAVDLGGFQEAHSCRPKDLNMTGWP